MAVKGLDLSGGVENAPERAGDAPRARAERPSWDLEAVVAELKLSRDVHHNIRHRGVLRSPPSREEIVGALQGLAAALFPAHYGPPGLTADTIDYFVGATLDRALSALNEQTRRSLPFSSVEDRPDAAFEREALRITGAFARQLPQIRGLLVSDIHAAYDNDPAATGYSEILLVYPGLTAVVHQPISPSLYQLRAIFLPPPLFSNAPFPPRLYIHPPRRIGGSFFIDHGTGVVIGETAVIGERVRLYQAVTLGARNFPTDGGGAIIKGAPRHPVIEDDVVIYAGATVLGRITVGRGSSVGGNVWLTHSVPAGSHITQAQSRSATGAAHICGGADAPALHLDGGVE